jgi:hypothetical protein
MKHLESEICVNGNKMKLIVSIFKLVKRPKPERNLPKVQRVFNLN